EGSRPRNIDLSTHWLGQTRDFESISGPLLSLKNLVMTFVTRQSFLKSRRKTFNAVDDVSFDIHEGEVFGLVGESGSGKSTVARMICSLYKPAAGEVNFAGTDLTRIKSESERDFYRRQMQMIFQDPFSSLNGRMKVMDIIAEPIRFRSEVFGLVGESGSGKSTVARMICSLYKPAAGEVNFAGTDLTRIKSESERDFYRRQMQMIFQDPFSSLNGRMKVMDIIAEPIRF